MKKYSFVFLVSLLVGCQNFGQLQLITDLPSTLKEVSGITTVQDSDLLWMHNDSGNKAIVYGVSLKGKIKEEISIDLKNKDWEDITSDGKGNLYIADFGNNGNKRKNLLIYKFNVMEAQENNEASAQKIKFHYPEQTKFPPKKKHRFFDAESVLFFKNYLYIFTKSRVKNKFGKTRLYKIPAKAGNYIAEFIAEFNNCNDMECWITSAAMSPDKKQVALLTHNEVLVFSDYKSDDFFAGKLTRFGLKHNSQKEGISFKDNNTLYITDERSHGKGGKLYEFSLN
ncbi:hypothetical protein WH52_14130 [Tenacibaculum holothuriorum]|uniref:Lipoprotein n=1 Tax=Tenacibaculum holothuriorum TaxID=1635173 RepID=A0A1Y2PB15_9FLAO|nr:hypothetical protein [Tenacibaculum holothuriorum]OSY86918.1 hypothetical protein WH52_14130 [Tenacibaculum holothuriorum]